MKDQKIKELFLDQLKRTPIIQACCEKTGISRATLYRWKAKDKSFAEKLDKALGEGTELVNDCAESMLISAIKDKNMTAITYWLKNKCPGYMPKLELSGKVKVENETLSEEQKSLIKKALELSGLNINDPEYDKYK